MGKCEPSDGVSALPIHGVCEAGMVWGELY